MNAIKTDDLPLYQRVAATLAAEMILGLCIYQADDGVHVEFHGARRAGQRITPRVLRRREQALHALLMRRFRVKAAILPNCASKLYLLVNASNSAPAEPHQQPLAQVVTA